MRLLWTLVWVTFAIKGKNTMLDSIIYGHLPNDDGNRSFCFRRLNQTAQVGCQSLNEPGNSGTLIFIGNDQSSFEDYLIDMKKVEFFAPYVFMMEISLLIAENMNKLVKADRGVAALVIYRNESIPLEHFSPDYSCPDLGQICEHKWNPEGSGIFWKDYSFPMIFYKNQTDIEQLRDDYEQYNAEASYPLLQYQVATFMRAAVNTPTCVRRSELNERSLGLDSAPTALCDLYDGFTTLTMLPASRNGPKTPESLPDKSAVAIITRSDSLALFHSTTSGVGAHTGSMMLQLAIGRALTLANITEALTKYSRSILLITLPSEDLKNVGSSSAVWDMSNTNKFPVEFPTDEEAQIKEMTRTFDELTVTQSIQEYLLPKQVKLSSFRNIIELGQIDAGPRQLFLHGKNGISSDILNTFTRNTASPELSFAAASEENGLPSSTLKAFIENEGYSDLGEKSFYLGNFDNAFENKFHNSMFDTLENFGFSPEFCSSKSSASEAKRLADLATSLARSAADLALTETEFDKGGLQAIEVKEEIIQELFCCFLGDPRKCDQVSNLFNITFSGRQVSPRAALILPHQRPPRFDFSATVSASASVPLRVYQNTMIYFTGDDVPCDSTNVTDCAEKCSQKNFETGNYDKLFEYRLLSNNTICKKSPSYFIRAQSPAAKEDGYDYETNLKNYPLWSESQWNGALGGARVFLKQSPTSENVILSLGILSVFFAFLISWLVKWKSSALFIPSEGFLNPVSTVAS